MNRIILIGNGFDLAHKMKTSYKDFINDYWESVITHLHQNSHLKEYNHDDFYITSLPRYWDGEKTYRSLKESLSREKIKFSFSNKFLEIISEKSFLNNWVDIECEYYDLLKELVENSTYSRYEDINSLNHDFEKIKRNLEEYLTKIESEFDKEFQDRFIKKEIGSKVYSSFKVRDFTEEIIKVIANRQLEVLENRKENLIKGLDQSSFGNNLILGADDDNPSKEVKELLLGENADQDFDLIPDQIVFLSFNYTSTDLLYDDPDKYLTFPSGFKKEVTTEFINIHGELNNPSNPLIFGFGDEIDNNYKKIEALNNNSFLKNIKSINYLETDNYKRFLQLLNDDIFQVFIFGHSCGLSDRTLLNTIFEHPNCGSIKPFYHKRKDDTNNYSEIVRNISRNFNNKSIMREKVVNKTYCNPLIE